MVRFQHFRTCGAIEKQRRFHGLLRSEYTYVGHEPFWRDLQDRVGASEQKVANSLQDMNVDAEICATLADGVMKLNKEIPS